MTSHSNDTAQELGATPFVKGLRWAKGWTVVPGDKVTKAPLVTFRQYTGFDFGADGRRASRAPTREEVRGWVEQGGHPLLLLDHPTDLRRCLVVIDTDIMEHDHLVVEKLEAHGIDLSKVPHVTTGREGGGVHRYFLREPGKEHLYRQGIDAKLFPEKAVDLKATRGYVVAAGAQHKSGLVYRATLGPGDVGPEIVSLSDVLAYIPVLPFDAYLDMRNGVPGSPRYKKSAAFQDSEVEYTAWSPEWEQILANGSDRQPCPWCQRGGDRVLTWHPDAGKAHCFREDVSRRIDGSRKAKTESGTFYSPTRKTTDAFDLPALPLPSVGPRRIDGSRKAKTESGTFYSPTRKTTDAFDLPALPLPSVGPRLSDAAALPVPGKPVEVWKAGRGSGKTHQAVRAAKLTGESGTCVVVSPIRSLVRQASQRFDLPYYEDLPKGEIRGSVAICAPSVHRVAILSADLDLDEFTSAGPDLLVLDESEQILNQIATSRGLYSPSEARRAYSCLVSLVSSAKRVLLLDADAGVLTARLVNDAGCADKAVWREGPDDPEREFVWVPQGQNQHIENILSEIELDYHPVVACQSRSTAEALAEQIGQRCPSKRVVLVTPKTVADVDLSPVSLRSADALVYSPVMATGVSIDIENHFTSIHLLACNVADGRQALQMVHRVRNPRSQRVLVSGPTSTQPPTWRMDPKVIRKECLRRASMTTDSLANGGIEVPQDLLHSQDAQRYFGLAILAQAGMVEHGEGWIVRYLCGNDLGDKEDPSPEAKQTGKEIADIRRDHAREVAKTVAEVDVLEASNVDPKDESVPYEVHKAARMVETFGDVYAASSTGTKAEMAYADRGGKLSRQTRTFGDVFCSHSPEGYKALREKDAATAKHATQDRWNHRAIRSRIFLQVLSEAGILKAVLDSGQGTNPELEDDGVRKLAAWASSHCKTLTMLGFTVRSDVKEKPYQFVSGVLGQLGLKLSVRQPKGPEGKQIRVYSLDLESVSRMVALSEAHRTALMENRTAMEQINEARMDRLAVDLLNQLAM